MNTDAITELVLVRWRDAYFDFDSPAGGAREDYLVETVGFLTEEGPTFLSIAAEMLPEGDGYRGVTHIPLPLVQEVRPLL